MKQLPLGGQDHTQESLHLAGCLWMCGRPIIETSTWQHTTLTKRQTSMPLVGFESTTPASKRPDLCLKLCGQRLACDCVWTRILLLLFLLHAETSRKPLMEVLETKSVLFHPGTYFLQYTIVNHTGNSFLWHKCKKKKCINKSQLDYAYNVCIGKPALLISVQFTCTGTRKAKEKLQQLIYVKSIIYFFLPIVSNYCLRFVYKHLKSKSFMTCL